MPALAIFIILLFGNWLLSDVLVFIPIHLLDVLGSWGWLTIGAVFLLFFSWCLGDG